MIKAGLFGAAYEEWHGRAPAQRIWALFKPWALDKFRLKKMTM